MPAPTLETARLILRPFTEDDFDDLCRQLSDPEVMRYYPPVPPGKGPREWLRGILADYDENGYGMLAMLLKETGGYIGQAGIMRRLNDSGDHHYLAYLLRREFWGRGLATEAAERLLEYGFQTLGVIRIEALVRPENERSVRVLERLGMQLAGNTEHAGYAHSVYAISRLDWTPPQPLSDKTVDRQTP